jgi:hypothetical protein
MISSRIVNSTTLRYFKLVKINEIVHPTEPLFLRESEQGIGESWLTHVSDIEARRVIEAHVKFLNELGAEVEEDGEPKKLTVRQQRLLDQPLRIEPAKRKAVKSPVGKKKAAKKPKTTGARSSKKP